MNNFCVLIPAFNEAATIGGIVEALKAKDIPTFVVDDGSSDETGKAAERAGAIVLKHEKNMGKGAAVRNGFKRILEDRNKFESVLVMDGDDQHEIRSIPDFLKAMEESRADIVIGNRMINPSSMPYVRNKTNRFMSYVLSKICGQYLPDTQCGFRLVRRKVIETLKLESSNFQIESELIIKACRKGFRVGSVPIRAVYGDEKSKINPITDTIRFFAFIIKMGFEKDG